MYVSFVKPHSQKTEAEASVPDSLVHRADITART